MTDLSGRTLGEFTLLERMDAGGMGVVYRAHQLRLDRPAVVKVLYRHSENPELRFLREAQLACRVDHPFAAHVYAFGCEPDGTLWIAMELIRGVSLAAWLARASLRKMSLERFVPLFEDICAVVHAAHKRNIVHRDIKPGNIMVVEREDKLEPRLLDFGLAKLLDGMPPAPGELRELPDTCDSSLSTSETAMGTPYYMAPELWTVPGTAGPSSDLYALGVVAFEALTGRVPFDGSSKESIGMEHISGRPAAAPFGLEAVFERALARYSEDRYSTALELAAAFRTVADAKLAGQIRMSAKQWIASGRSTSLVWRGDMLAQMEEWHRRSTKSDSDLSDTAMEFVEASRTAGVEEAALARRQARRERRIGIGVAVIIGLVGLGGLEVRGRLAEQRAEDAENQTRAVQLTAEIEQGRAALLHDDMPEAQRHLGAAVGMGDRSEATRFMYSRAMQPVRAQLAQLTAIGGRMWSASWSEDGRLIATADDRGAQIWNAVTYQLLFELRHDDTVYDVRWSGDRLVTACGDGSVRVFSAQTGSLVKELRLQAKQPRWRFVSVVGQLVAAVDTQGAIAAVWDVDGAAATLDLDGSEWPSVALSPDGRWLAAGGGDRVMMLELATGKHTEIHGPGIRTIAWSGSLLTGSTAGDASIWSTAGVRLVHLREVGEPVDAVAWSPDGSQVTTASRDGAVQVWSASGQRISQGNEIHGKVTALAFSEDGKRVAAAGAHGDVAVTEASTGMAIARLGGQTGPVKAVHLSGERVLAASWDGTARVWDARSPYRLWASEPLADGCGMVGSGSDDGEVMAVGCPGHPTRIWRGDRLLAELPPLDRVVPAPYPVVVGDRIAIAHGVTAELYGLDGKLIFQVNHGSTVTAVAVQGGELVSGDSNGAVMLDGRIESEGDPVDAIAVVGGRILVADARGLRGVVKLPNRARMLRMSPDGRRVLVVPNHTGVIWSPVLVDLASGMIVAHLDSPQIYSARWTPSGILTTHADGSVRMWNGNGRIVQTYRSNAPALFDADLAGSSIVGAAGDGTLRFWDAATGRPLWSMRAHRRIAFGVRANAHDIVTRGSAGEISHWRIP